MSVAASQPIENKKSAPLYYVPSKRIVSIEHPCIVKNFDNGFKSLGGEHNIKRVLEHEVGNDKRSGAEPIVVASLRPNDPFAQKLQSAAKATDNVLVKVTLPKRTGRKRKRGSDEPFQTSPTGNTPSDSITATELLERLRDQPESYKMQAIGYVEDTHRFQSLPDFQIRADGDSAMREVRDHIMNPSYETLKRFSMSRAMEFGSMSSFPGPPAFLPTGRPYQYEYRQALGGERSTKKRRSGIGIAMMDTGIALDTEPVPQSLPAGDRKAGRVGQKMVDAFKSLLEKRPIVTLRAAASLLNCHYTKISFVVQYVGYYVTQGPWEGAIVKYGLDPRSDPKYRFYQTLQFHFENNKNINAELKTREQTGPVHIFDGKYLGDIGKTWQICDLTDPVLQALANSNGVREQCDTKRFGWYKNGTLAKMRVITREKMLAVIHGDILISETGYGTLAALPDRIDNEFQCDLGKGTDLYVQKMAKQISKQAINGPYRTDRRHGTRLQAVRAIGQQGAGSTVVAASPSEPAEDEGTQELDLDRSDEDSGEGESEEDGMESDNDIVDE